MKGAPVLLASTQKPATTATMAISPGSMRTISSRYTKQRKPRHSGSISTSASGTVTISTLPRGTMVPAVTLKLTLVTGGYSVTR